MMMRKDSINIVDVRAQGDYQKGHVPGAKSLPKSKWASLEGLSREQTNVIYCYSQTCHLAAHAAHEFSAKGFPVMELEGGFEGWVEHKYDTEM